MGAIIGGQAPPALVPVPPAPPPRRAPKLKMPDEFNGKSTTEARHFLRQCHNYLTTQQLGNPEDEIQFVLALLTSGAAQWRDEKQDELTPGLPMPAHMANYNLFEAHFRARWGDPHEEEKMLDKIMKGNIVQRTSVKIYNDKFNEALGLTTLTGADISMLRAYMTGLKPTVRNTAIAPLHATPNMAFHAHQSLMVDIDETLMQTRQAAAPAPARRTVINNPVINLQSATPVPPSTASCATTPARGTMPIKVEVARQYTKLTPEEQAELARMGSCFRCWEQGHMAHQCPRGNR